MLHVREQDNAAHHLLQIRVNAVLDIGKEYGNFPEGLQHCPEFAEGDKVNVGPFIGQHLEEADAVDVSVGREGLLEHDDEPHLVGKLKSPAYFLRVRGEFFFRCPCRGIFGAAPVRYYLPDPIEP